MARLERIIERLELKEFQLRSLLDVTKAINNNVGRAELLALYEHIVREELGITRLMLFERAQGWERILAYGADGRASEPDVESLFSSYQDIQVINSETAGSLGAFDVAVPVYHREQPLAFLLIGDIDEEEQRMSPTVKHLNFIQTLTNLIVVAMENKRLALEALRRERQRRDLELAAEAQGMLLPRDLPSNERFEAAAWYQPLGELGGDYYDLFPRGDGRWMLAVADVAGKGVSASLLMSNFQAALRLLVRHGQQDMDRLVRSLNEQVHASARGERFITLFLADLDLDARRMRYVSAGHNPALLHTAEGIQPLKDGTIPLGMMASLPFLNVGEVALPDTSTLLCYTDGLVEQEDPQGREFGTEPLETLLNGPAAHGCRALNQAIMDAFEAHRGTVPYLDDIALISCRIQ